MFKKECIYDIISIINLYIITLYQLYLLLKWAWWPNLHYPRVRTSLSDRANGLICRSVSIDLPSNMTTCWHLAGNNEIFFTHDALQLPSLPLSPSLSC